MILTKISMSCEGTPVLYSHQAVSYTGERQVGFDTKGKGRTARTVKIPRRKIGHPWAPRALHRCCWILTECGSGKAAEQSEAAKRAEAEMFLSLQQELQSCAAALDEIERRLEG